MLVCNSVLCWSRCHHERHGAAATQCLVRRSHSDDSVPGKTCDSLAAAKCQALWRHEAGVTVHTSQVRQTLHAQHWACLARGSAYTPATCLSNHPESVTSRSLLTGQHTMPHVPSIHKQYHTPESPPVKHNNKNPQACPALMQLVTCSAAVPRQPSPHQCAASASPAAAQHSCPAQQRPHHTPSP